MKRNSKTIKNVLVSLFTISCVLFVSCQNASEPADDDSTSKDGDDKKELVEIDYESKKNTYGSEFTITGGDYTEENGVITLTNAKAIEYTFSGYYKGQIKSSVKETVLVLSNFYIENTNGEPAIKGSKKIIVKSAADTVNYVVSSGENLDGKKVGAIDCDKKVVLDGSGTLNVVGSVYHGIKCDDSEIKSSGKIYLQGTGKGSALNCENLSVADDVDVTMYLINSKNGIKADGTIDIKAGTYNLYKLTCGFKTDTAADDIADGKDAEEHIISLSNCTVKTKDVGKLYSTEEDGLTEADVTKEELK